MKWTWIESNTLCASPLIYFFSPRAPMSSLKKFQPIQSIHLAGYIYTNVFFSKVFKKLKFLKKKIFVQKIAIILVKITNKFVRSQKCCSFTKILFFLKNVVRSQKWCPFLFVEQPVPVSLLNLYKGKSFQPSSATNLTASITNWFSSWLENQERLRRVAPGRRISHWECSMWPRRSPTRSNLI